MKLRDARRRKFYSATDLAEKADVSAGTIYAIEAGRELPTLRTARLLAAALEIDPLEVDEFSARLSRRALGNATASLETSTKNCSRTFRKSLTPYNPKIEKKGSGFWSHPISTRDHTIALASSSRGNTPPPTFRSRLRSEDRPRLLAR